jgi:hypothetical protein
MGSVLPVLLFWQCWTWSGRDRRRTDAHRAAAGPEFFGGDHRKPVIGRSESRAAYEYRLHLPYGKPVTVVTDLGTWTIDATDRPRCSAKGLGLASE